MRRRSESINRIPAAASAIAAIFLVAQLWGAPDDARAQQPPDTPDEQPPTQPTQPPPGEPPPGEPPPEEPLPGGVPQPSGEDPEQPPPAELTVQPPPGALTTEPFDQAAPILLDPADTIILLLDHQTGLLQTVQDIPVQDLRANTVVRAPIGGLAQVPVITTASEPEGPNGPLLPELAEAAPRATYVARKGEISAWDNADFRRAVEATGRRTLVVAGIWTSVCVALPALQAKAEGYNVYAVIDASGDMSEMASETTVERLAQAGVIPVTTNVVLAELQRTWARPDATQWGALYSALVPHYRAVSESYQKARQPRGTIQGPQGRR